MFTTLNMQKHLHVPPSHNTYRDPRPSSVWFVRCFFNTREPGINRNIWVYALVGYTVYTVWYLHNYTKWKLTKYSQRKKLGFRHNSSRESSNQQYDKINVSCMEPLITFITVHRTVGVETQVLSQGSTLSIHTLQMNTKIDLIAAKLIPYSAKFSRHLYFVD